MGWMKIEQNRTANNDKQSAVEHIWENVKPTHTDGHTCSLIDVPNIT